MIISITLVSFSLSCESESNNTTQHYHGPLSTTTTVSTSTTTTLQGDDDCDDDSEASTTTIQTTTTSTTTTIFDDDTSDDDSGDDDSGINYQPGDVVIGAIQGGENYGGYIYIVSNSTDDKKEIISPHGHEKHLEGSSIAIIPTITKGTSEYYLGLGTSYPAVASDTFGYLHMVYFDHATGTLNHLSNSSGSWVRTIVNSPIYGSEKLIYKIDSQNIGHIYYLDGGVGIGIYCYDLSNGWNCEGVPGAEGGLYCDMAPDSQSSVHITCLGDGPYITEIMYITNKTGAWVLQTAQTIPDPIMGGQDGTFWETTIAIDSHDIPNICSAYIYSLPNSPLASYGGLFCGNNQGGMWNSSTEMYYPSTTPHDLNFLLDHNDYYHLFFRANYGISHATNASGHFVRECISYPGGDAISATLDQFDNFHIAFLNGNLVFYCTDASGAWKTIIVN